MQIHWNNTSPGPIWVNGTIKTFIKCIFQNENHPTIWISTVTFRSGPKFYVTLRIREMETHSRQQCTGSTSGGSIINWPPGSGSLLLNKDSKFFLKKEYFIIFDYSLAGYYVFDTKNFFHGPKIVQVGSGSWRIQNYLSSRNRIRNSGLSIRIQRNIYGSTTLVAAENI